MSDNMYDNKMMFRSSAIVIQHVIILFLISLTIISCSSTVNCPKVPSDGNISNPVNTDDSEISPFIYDKEIYYTSNKHNTERFIVFAGTISLDSIINIQPMFNSGFSEFNNPGLVKLYRNIQLNRTFAYFAAISNSGANSNSDIYYMFKNSQDKWSDPIAISVINTEFFESYPCVSPDGTTLVFASDRPNGIGGIDLYKSTIDIDGEWSEPILLTESVNTSGDEISPFINFDNSLVFSSKSEENRKYDIYSALDNGSGQWVNKRALPHPINSDYDDITPAIFDNNLYLASNRPGGCGNYDIYKFKYCGDVFLDGSIEGENPDFPLEGKLYLFNSDKELLNVYEINEQGKFRIPLEPSNLYYLQYFNSCIPNYIPEQQIVAPCSDTNIVVIYINFIIPETKKSFDFANYKVPFFVSGYYHPNTTKSLESLRLKFAYNLLGNNPATKYIEKPGNEYDDYAIIVENALDETINHIIKILETSNDECIKNNKKFKIKITGYSDPRILSEFSKFTDESINDKSLGFSIEKDESVDNVKLSRMRAYFTAKYIKTSIMNKISPKEFGKIQWEIEGLGIDESEKPNEQKRRVNIEIGLSE